MAASADIAALATEALAAIDHGRQIAPFSSRAPLSLDDAYRATAAMRQTRLARGERAIGRKFGFTNRTIWPEYGVYAPMWGYVYDRTLRNLADIGNAFPLTGLCEPRIEPEIVFGLARAPSPGMDDVALMSCIEWVAPGFELVQSIYPAWKFSAADTVAANGLHAVLLIGPRHPVRDNAAEWLRTLTAFEIDLACNGQHRDRGRALNVMEGPVSTLRYAMDPLAVDRDNPPLSVGEVVTTGTLTKALPVAPGETWTTRLEGVNLPNISVRFV
jgi:2-oxo-3-hexenedioate decarboxylase